MVIHRISSAVKKVSDRERTFPPSFFAIYLNDLETYMDLYNCKGVEIGIHDENVLIFLKLFVILYADDTIILSSKIYMHSDWLCNEVKKRLQCQYLQKWNTEIQTSSKSINYRIFKTNFVTEFYITHLQPKFYIPLARFRTTNNRLPIERGRWENVKRAQRICTLCNYNAIGDEFHYLFECKAFKERRKVFLPRFYLRHVNTLKFQMLLCTTNVTLLKRLSRFISEILSKF